ncbi:MAG TPA: NAD-binding protein [Aquabacterium sp.]|nr:NAD-binding protein [Aquabacterium sp.]HRH27985.1 NAD-binding protein [Aquabacterium sp.]
MITPILARWGTLLGDRLDARLTPPTQALKSDLPEYLSGHVVLAGFGRVGQLTADVLRGQGVPFIALEQDANVVAQWRARGEPVFYGNAARPELLHKLHVDRASVVVITMDHPASTLHAVKGIREACPELPIVARSRDEKHAQELRRLGANQVIPETLETGLQLSAAVLHSLGVPELAISQVIERERGLRVDQTGV